MPHSTPERPPGSCRPAIFFAALAGTLLSGSCSVPPPTVAAHLDPASGSIRAVLEESYRTTVTPWPDSADAVARLADRDVLVFLAAEPAVPLLAIDEAGRRALHEYVQQGGGLLLLGYATRLAYELGLESTPPDRYEPYVWGLDQHTLVGDYRYGFRAVTGQGPELVAELQAAGAGDAYLVGGGELAEVQSCHWEAYWPRDGEVLGQLSRVRDGEPADLDPVVLTRWTEGAGAVLGYGSVPEPWRPDPQVRTNAERFLHNALALVHGAAPRSVALCVAPVRRKGTGADAALAPLGEREVPGAVMASHWGWQVALNYLHESQEPLGPRQVLEQVLLPAWRAGADLLDLHAADLRRGYPLAWRPDDPLARPESYWGQGFWPEWSAESLADLAREAHARGMLLQAWLRPAPVRSGHRLDLLAAARWIARELLELRLRGGGALDGIGIADWFRDPRGLTLAAIQDHHPGAHLYDTGGAARPIGVAVLDAERGRPRGLNAAGVSETWRGRLLDQHPAAMLDARSRRPSLRLWGNDHARGGGSYGDWLLTQANDFVRARRGRAPALWWHAFNPATLDPAAVAYVHGISMDPLKAAVAGRLWSTGRGGYREQLAGTVPDVQSGFGAESVFEASSHFLQNNHLRVHGTGGAWLVDPGGLARFRLGGPGTVVLAPELMRTRLFGGRPDAAELRPGEIDLLGGSRRGESGYGHAVTIRGRERGTGGFPAVLAQDDRPRWPRRVDVHFHPAQGLYELRLGLRGVAGSGVVELRRDGELVHVIRFRSPVEERRVLPFPVARPGERSLSLEVVDGGSVAVETLELARREDVASEGRVALRAGHRAALDEWTASTYHADRIALTTLADLPGLLLSVDYQRMSRSLRVERRFAFTHHRRLALASAGEDPAHLRGPFVLASDHAQVPDLAVVPLTLARHDRFAISDEGLVLLSQPRAYETLQVGFLLLRDVGAAALPRLRELFADLAEPVRLELDGTGPAAVASDLPFSWVRALRVHNPWGTPYLVRENGWWIHRGAQAAPGGGDWLRIHHRPGDVVQILAGPDLLARNRPGPGSLHSVVLRDGDGSSGGAGRTVTARVLQVGPLAPAPAVTMAGPFQAVRLEGRPWSYFDGATIYLPRQVGDYEIEVQRHAAGPAPHLLRTRADVRDSHYDPSRRVLTITTRAGDRRPPDLPYTALIAGPEPTAIEGGVRVEEDELAYRDGSDRSAAVARGVVVRFRPGTLRLHYGRPDS